MFGVPLTLLVLLISCGMAVLWVVLWPLGLIVDRLWSFIDDSPCPEESFNQLKKQLT